MMPGTYQAVYNASKSFVQSFAEALRNELKDTGVSVTALMPGPTETNFFHRAEMDDTKVGASSKDDPAVVAKQGFEALMKGDQKVVAGSLKTKAQAAASKVMPDSAKAPMHRGMAEPGSGDKCAGGGVSPSVSGWTRRIGGSRRAMTIQTTPATETGDVTVVVATRNRRE